MDKEKIKEFKRELSALTGDNMFNPKYRELFIKYFGGADDDNAEIEALQDKGIINEDEAQEMKKEAVETTSEDKEEKPVVEEAKEEAVEDKVEDIDKAEDEREIDKIEEDKAETPATEEEKKEEVAEETAEIGKEVNELKDENPVNQELLDAKIELELVRSGVREDKIAPAMRLIKTEVKTLDELDKVKDIIADYPEWLNSYKARDFGMSVDEKGDGLTAEQKRLKAMGIDPRD